MSIPRDAYKDMVDHRDDGRLEPLAIQTCLRLLADCHVGRVALNDPAGPVVFPVNYTVDNGTVVFRSTVGTKLGAAEVRTLASFQVDHVDERRRLGWSVLVRGRLVEVTDADELDRLRELPLEPFTGGTKDHFIRVMPASVTGRQIPVPEVIPADWLRSMPGHTWWGRDGDDLLG